MEGLIGRLASSSMMRLPCQIRRLVILNQVKDLARNLVVWTTVRLEKQILRYIQNDNFGVLCRMTTWGHER